MIRNAGEGAAVVEGDTKSGKPRVVDLDPATVALLRAWRREHGLMALPLVREDALVFGDIEGAHRSPEHLSRQFVRDVTRCRAALGTDALPLIRTHDLRHSHATTLQVSGVAPDASLGGSRERRGPGRRGQRGMAGESARAGRHVA
jgi:integrase